MTESNNITSLNEHKKKKQKTLFPDDMVMGFQLNSSMTDEQIGTFWDEFKNGKVYITLSSDSSKVLAFKKP